MGNRQIFMRNLHNKLRTEPVGLHRVSITPRQSKPITPLISCVKAGVIGLFPQRLTIYAPQSKLSQVTARQKSFNTECTEGAERRREQLEYVQRLLWEIRLGFSLCPLCSLRSLCYRFSVGVHRFPVFPRRPPNRKSLFFFHMGGTRNPRCRWTAARPGRLFPDRGLCGSNRRPNHGD